MELDAATLGDLSLQLRQDRVRSLSPAELRAVLGWIGGREGEDAHGLTTHLGPGDADPALLRQVYRQLDRVLFSGDLLREAEAGLTGDTAERLAQYRRLLAVFHPDRSPELAAWLTPRFQAVQRSYRRFRDTTPEPFVARVPPASAPASAEAATASRGWRRRIRFGPGLRVLLQNQLREVRHLEAKVVGLVVIAALLAVLHVYLVHAPDRWTQLQEQQTRRHASDPRPVVSPADRPPPPPQGMSGLAAGPAWIDGSTGSAAATPANAMFAEVTGVVHRYRHAFEEGNIEVLMRLLSNHPRENRNQGRDWFRITYARVFARSDLRRLQIDIATVEPEGDAWIVAGQFDLAVHYPGGRRVSVSGPIRYRLVRQSEEWHIAGIDY